VVPLLTTAGALISDVPGSVFLLSFARRNVSINKVLEAAVKMGWTHR
jgi:hypothetical protein